MTTDCSDRLMLEIRAALVHTVAAHPGHLPFVEGPGLCESEVQIVCGKHLFARIQALRAEASEAYMRKARGE
jgi:hypothetical protein